MPSSRRSHTKSRRGCQQCKQRHVKCDETTPSCGYCLKRQVTCSFRTENGVNNGSRTASPSDRAEIAASPPKLSEMSRTLELRLMHNWSTKTFRTMDQHPDELPLWQTVVPELALSYDFLLDTLLALSARHLSFEDPVQAPAWDCAALDYQNRALTSFQLALGETDATNCEAIFGCSVLIMVFSLAQSQWQPETHLSDALVDTLELRQFLMGVGMVYGQYIDQLRLSEFGVLFTPHTPTQMASENSTGLPLPDMCRVVDTTLETLQLAASKTPHDTVYSGAISNLQHAMRTYCSGGIFAGIMGWPVGLCDKFVASVENKEPLAIAIFAHYGVIIHLLRDRWWARNAGMRLVRTILPILRDSKPDWAALVQQAWAAVVNDQSSHNTPSTTL